MRKFFILLSLLFLFVAAAPKEQEHLTTDQMVATLIDIHLLEAITGWQELNEEEQAVYFRRNLDIIFQSHHITPQLFNDSVDYYITKQLGVMDDIYQNVVEGLREKKRAVTTTPL